MSENLRSIIIILLSHLILYYSDKKYRISRWILYTNRLPCLKSYRKGEPLHPIQNPRKRLLNILQMLYLLWLRRYDGKLIFYFLPSFKSWFDLSLDPIWKTLICHQTNLSRIFLRIRICCFGLFLRSLSPIVK